MSAFVIDEINRVAQVFAHKIVISIFVDIEFNGHESVNFVDCPLIGPCVNCFDQLSFGHAVILQLTFEANPWAKLKIKLS